MLAAKTLARHARVLSAQRVAPMSSLVLSIVGPDRTGLVSEVTQIVAGRGGNVTESHSFNIGPVYSMAMMVDVGADQHSELVAAVTAAVPSYAISAHVFELLLGGLRDVLERNMKRTTLESLGIISHDTDLWGRPDGGATNEGIVEAVTVARFADGDDVCVKGEPADAKRLIQV